jgi:bifunctional non-homologous end joining protein LigD
MTLSAYRKKRNFAVTPEPKGQDGEGQDGAERRLANSLGYAMQKHMASRLHYDLRLEWRGVLLSWAIPRGPSLNPAVKRLAVQTEDHPLEYADFEGVIPAEEYGAGTVLLWDKGTWQPENLNADGSLPEREIKFKLAGKKLRGSWVLVHTRGMKGSGGGSIWLLIKHRDQYASASDVTVEEPWSVATQRLLSQIARDEGGDVARASTGDPPRRAPYKKRAKPAQERAKSRRSG